MKIKSVCGYCGVGCGIEYDTRRLVGDIDYPVNEGLVCSKGASELHTIETPTRLLRPKLRKAYEDFTDISWEMAIETIVHNIRSTSPERIGFYLSGQMLTEDYYVANKLGKGFLGTNNVDTNSRTCMASAVVAHKKVFGADYVPVRMEEIEHCNLLIMIGANPAEAHVVFNNKIKKAKKEGLKTVVIDPRRTETAEQADLHLPIRVGTDIDFLSLVARRIVDDGKTDNAFLDAHVNGFDAYLKKIKKIPTKKLLKRCGLEEEAFEAFMELFYESENVISAWTMGLNQSAQGVDKNLALINLHLLTGKINRPGNGPFSLTGQPNAMGGREVGGLATTLAVHLDFNEESIAKVSEFWGTQNIAPAPGLTAFEMIEAAERRELDVLIICHTDPVYHLPNRKRVEAALKKVPFIVEINAYDDSETKPFAHLRLPAAPWGEKEGTQTNMDRSITRQERLTRRSIDCKPDWEIFTMIGRAMGFVRAFDYQNAEAIWDEYRRMTALSPKGHMDISGVDAASLKNGGYVWGEGLFDDNEFLTPDGKANLIFVQNERRSENTSLEFPYLLTTGRTRDQWHSGTKTAFVERLLKHKPLSYIEINSEDAQSAGIADGDKVKVTTARGALVFEAKVTENIREKTLFVPVTDRRINYLTNDLLDPESKEPDYNHNAAKLEKWSG
ncbi:molybdopterin oxidoreductase family protein [Sulfurimonas sp. HSL-1656]|uniref:molybdopterin oxidoreductase family protein n=1 Tax=Thiomicrolovo subterrani TaxID=3131934 RepID=UPI0031F7B664